MKVKTERLPHGMVKLTVTAEAEAFEMAIGKAYREKRGQSRISGFKPGKVPRHMVEKLYGEDVFYGDAANILMSELYREALQEGGLAEVGAPENVTVVQMGRGQEFIFSVDVPAEPEVTLGQYVGLMVDKGLSPGEKERAVLKQLVANAQMEIPEAMIEFAAKQRLAEVVERVNQQQGGEFPEEEVLRAIGRTKEECLREFRPAAEEEIAIRYTLKKIVETEGITATEEELEAEFAAMGANYQMSVEEVKKNLISFGLGFDGVKQDICVRKAKDFVLEHVREV